MLSCSVCHVKHDFGSLGISFHALVNENNYLSTAYAGQLVVEIIEKLGHLIDKKSVQFNFMKINGLSYLADTFER